MAGVDLISEKSMNELVSKMPGVRDAVREHAGEVYFRAVANLQGHRDTGAATIEIDTPSSYEHWGVNVWLVDPAALSIEFGHYVRMANGFPRFVAGLYILSKAAGLM